MNRTHPAEQQELSQRLVVGVFVQVAQHGPRTTQDLSDTKIVSNADDAIASMARLINEDRAIGAKFDRRQVFRR